MAETRLDEELALPARTLNARAANKTGRRCWGRVIVRRSGEYRVLVRTPDGQTRVVAVVPVEKPSKGRKVRLRVMVDAVEVSETPPKREREDV